MADQAATSETGNHKFVALYDHEVEWQEGATANELLALPPGVKVKVLNYDPVMKRVDMKVKFPPGFVEPEHSHKSWHSIVVLEGRMCVAGKDLRPGDYVFGGDIPHGPYEYPDGCVAFCVFMGEGTEHEWDESKHLAHQSTWEAETDAGKTGVEQQQSARDSGKVSSG